MKVEMISPPELHLRAFRVLCREMGVIDTLRFLGQVWPGWGDYTRERRQIFGDLTLDEYRKAISEKKD
jgi:hypothetical protein